ncbi:MAG: plastocyanin/azurin family copper-binding protein [Azospirillaceae bacterium]
MPVAGRTLFARAFTPVALAAAAFLAAPAGAAPGHDDGHGHGHDAEPTAAQIDRTIEIEASDMAFTPDAIEVAAGETIRFVVTNTGAVLHEFAVDTPASHEAHRDEMRAMMADGATMAEMAHDHGSVISLEPGETAELVVTVEDPAAVEIACNLPGHYEAGMHGAIRPTGGEAGS